jgi:hypothetical protein
MKSGQVTVIAVYSEFKTEDQILINKTTIWVGLEEKRSRLALKNVNELLQYACQELLNSFWAEYATLGEEVDHCLSPKQFLNYWPVVGNAIKKTIRYYIHFTTIRQMEARG